MVYHGPSRGCQTCKKRRKKCDLDRPSCRRCLKANIACLGYKDDSKICFRHYNLHPEPVIEPVSSRSPTTSDSLVPHDALSSFFAGYCVKSIDRAVSRGFLDGLDAVIDHAGHSSDIAEAAKIVCLAADANRTGNRALLEDTALVYGRLLHSFQASLANAVAEGAIQPLMMTVLLGIYEVFAHNPTSRTSALMRRQIIVSSEADYGCHDAHVRGVSAILSADNSPFDLLAATRLFQMSNPLLVDKAFQSDAPGVLCAPDPNPSVKSLDAILINVDSMWRRANALFSDPTTSLHDLLLLKEAAAQLDSEFCEWSISQPKQWNPITVGFITDHQAKSSPFIPAWPGPVETHFDLYVAAVYNTYRKTHIMILEVLAICSERLQIPSNHAIRGQKLAEDIAASVPYHLTSDVNRYLCSIQNDSQPFAVGKPVGGLFLLHPLNVVLRSRIVSLELREHMSNCLAWIGSNFGIGQASLLSNPVANLPFQFIANGHMLIWAGMLIHPF